MDMAKRLCGTASEFMCYFRVSSLSTHCNAREPLDSQQCNDKENWSIIMWYFPFYRIEWMNEINFCVRPSFVGQSLLACYILFNTCFRYSTWICAVSSLLPEPPPQPPPPCHLVYPIDPCHVLSHSLLLPPAAAALLRHINVYIRIFFASDIVLRL